MQRNEGRSVLFLKLAGCVWCAGTREGSLFRDRVGVIDISSISIVRGSRGRGEQVVEG